tara:strand:+ start:1235 stop:1435 length:201 start_codon:yes stop_codon:yes gene_type:complete
VKLLSSFRISERTLPDFGLEPRNSKQGRKSCSLLIKIIENKKPENSEIMKTKKIILDSVKDLTLIP